MGNSFEWNAVGCCLPLFACMVERLLYNATCAQGQIRLRPCISVTMVLFHCY